MKTESAIRQTSGDPWEKRRQEIIATACKSDGLDLAQNPETSRIADAVASLAAHIVGRCAWHSALTLDEVRLVWWELQSDAYRSGRSFDESPTMETNRYQPKDSPGSVYTDAECSESYRILIFTDTKTGRDITVRVQAPIGEVLDEATMWVARNLG